jgi:PAS domain S-box-containing protein
MRLHELVDVGVLRQLVEANYKANGRVIAVVDAVDGSILVGMGWQRICTEFHRVHPVAASRCRASDACVNRRAVEDTPCEYRCRNGLYDIGIPILVEGEHLASVFFGQFFYEGEPIDRDFFVRQARQFGFDEREYLAALDLVPAYDRATVDNVLQYNRALARLIADLAQRALAQAKYESALHAAAEEAKGHARELELVLDTVPAAVFITRDREARDMTVNRAGSEILGVGPDANVSMNAPPERRTTRFRVRQRGVARSEELPVQVAARGGVPVRNAELELEFDDGAVRHFIGNAAPMRGSDGEVRGAVGAFVDVTELRRAEEALREANRRKDDFLAVLSHELRNPLAPIRNAVAVLQRAEPGSEQTVRARQVIDRQVAHISRLVDDLLDVSRIAQGKLRLIRERVCLREIVRRTVDDHRILFARRKIALTLEEGAQGWVQGDSTRLGQVIGNLLQNAAKFTDAGGRVAVTLDEEAESAVIRVRDDGAGMDRETQDGLFLPFVQAEKTLDRTLGGLGLGLSLAKSIVELHGGSIAASSAGLGHGSEFVVRLPVAPGRAVSPAPPAVAVRPRVRGRVLVVEDNEDSAATLADLLRLEGHQVSVAHDGRRGLEAALAWEPDVVLCDLGLPGMDGYEVARRLRAGGSRARLVALTGYAAPEDVERARQAGFDAHLAKPPDLDKLLLAVEEPGRGACSP